MNISLLDKIKKTSYFLITSATPPMDAHSQFRVLTPSEIEAVAGGPQVQNNPDT